jgi:hypothetical protein
MDSLFIFIKVPEKILNKILIIISIRYMYILNFLLIQVVYYTNFSKKLAHNVPAVYDGLTARIEKCAAFLGLANCGWSEPWEWSVAE